ncbi:MAG: hypothetical protein BWK77_04595 [Verrucomicrobia bacterium A1]|nr:MAG: hypothetical protein BWK77_04595 [Verrucomicrobia bacterium A1]
MGAGPAATPAVCGLSRRIQAEPEEVEQIGDADRQTAVAVLGGAAVRPARPPLQASTATA